MTGLHIDAADEQHTSSPPRVLVTVRGELDMHSAPELRAAIADRVEASPGVEVALDLSGLSFVDSSGLSALIAVQRAAAEAGGGLVLCDPAEPVRRMLRITGLRSVLAVADTGPAGEGERA